MQRAFKRIAPNVEVRVITNGQDAADFFAATLQTNGALAPLAGGIVIVSGDELN